MPAILGLTAGLGLWFYGLIWGAHYHHADTWLHDNVHAGKPVLCEDEAFHLRCDVPTVYQGECHEKEVCH